MLNAFFATIKTRWRATGLFGSYFNTGTVATSSDITAVGSSSITLTVGSNSTGGTPQYKINAGAWTTISSGTPFAITNGQLLGVRVNGMSSSGDALITLTEPGGYTDNYNVTKI